MSFGSSAYSYQNPFLHHVVEIVISGSSRKFFVNSLLVLFAGQSLALQENSKDFCLTW